MSKSSCVQRSISTAASIEVSAGRRRPDVVASNASATRDPSSTGIIPARGRVAAPVPPFVVEEDVRQRGLGDGTPAILTLHRMGADCELDVVELSVGTSARTLTLPTSWSAAPNTARLSCSRPTRDGVRPPGVRPTRAACARVRIAHIHGSRVGGNPGHGQCSRRARRTLPVDSCRCGVRPESAPGENRVALIPEAAAARRSSSTSPSSRAFSPDTPTGSTRRRASSSSTASLLTEADAVSRSAARSRRGRRAVAGHGADRLLGAHRPGGHRAPASPGVVAFAMGIPRYTAVDGRALAKDGRRGGVLRPDRSGSFRC